METIKAAKVGAGPRWEPLLSLDRRTFYGELDLGNGASYIVGLFITTDGKIGFGVLGKGFQVFDHKVDPGSIVSDYGVSDADSRNICDFLNIQMGVEYREIGNYVFKFCRP